MKFRFCNTPVVCCKAAISQKIPAACCKCQWSSNYDTHFWTPNQNNASGRTALFTLFCKQKLITRVLLLKTTPLYPFNFFFKTYIETHAIYLSTVGLQATCPFLLQGNLPKTENKKTNNIYYSGHQKHFLVQYTRFNKMGESVWEVSRVFLRYVREGATKCWVKQNKTHTKQKTPHPKRTPWNKNSWLGWLVCDFFAIVLVWGFLFLIKKLLKYHFRSERKR